MQRSEEPWQRARMQADDFLRRFGDAWTRTHREDLVQEAAIAAWRWAGADLRPPRLGAAVRTIAARLRSRALRLAWQRRQVHEHAAIAAVDDDRGEPHLRVGGRSVPMHLLQPCLHRALARLQPIDRQLLAGFQEGFCCAELGERTRRSEVCVKTRLHRARRRLRRDIEACVRAAGDLDG